jgi:outer membrane protein TolC
VETVIRALSAAQDRVDAASSGWVPDPTLGLGYKDQSDGFSGAALTLDIPIPLFDRRGGAHDAARARQVAAAAALDLRTREARNDVLAASARYESSRGRLAGVGESLLQEADALR